MYRRLIPYLLVAIASGVLTTIFQPWTQLQTLAQGQGQQARCVTFKETGRTVCGRFLEYWNKNGGLAQQGFPLTETFVEVSDLDGKPYAVQYFERAVFELHPENKAPYDVLLSQLGTFRYREKYSAGVPTPGAVHRGAIEGALSFPSEVVPAMQIYAIEAVGLKFYSVRTALNQQTYTIQGVPPGAYYVVGYLADNPYNAGAYTQFVLCGLRADCTDHSLVPVVVRPGETTRGADVKDFYAPAGSFPTNPELKASPLVYMWPKTLPQGLAIQKDKSSADNTRFVLELAQSGGGQFFATITGGPGSAAATPPSRGTQTTVRGLPATLFTTGAGYSVFWSERGNPYAVIGGLARDAALALAESLEPVDLATWRARLAQVR